MTFQGAIETLNDETASQFLRIAPRIMRHGTVEFQLWQDCERHPNGR